MKFDDADDLEYDDKDWPTLELNQVVNVVTGKYAGRSGKVHFVRNEGDSTRITLIDGKEYLYVSCHEIDFKFEAVEVALYLPDEERAEWFRRIEENEEGSNS